MDYISLIIDALAVVLGIFIIREYSSKENKSNLVLGVFLVVSGFLLIYLRIW
jgi:hypothetical protein